MVKRTGREVDRESNKYGTRKKDDNKQLLHKYSSARRISYACKGVHSRGGIWWEDDDARLRRAMPRYTTAGPVESLRGIRNVQ